MESLLTYWDSVPRVADRFKTGVSLHSHTLHSEESVLPLGQYLREFAWLQGPVERAHRRYGDCSFEDDLSRIWWTPPLAPRQALDLEALQIEGKLGLDPIVSISDHDSIHAPMELQVLGRSGKVPVSVEWSVPYRDTCFHIGVHNQPVQQEPWQDPRILRYRRLLRSRFEEFRPDVVRVTSMGGLRPARMAPGARIRLADRGILAHQHPRVRRLAL